MKRYMNHHASAHHLLPFVLVASLVLPVSALAAPVALATAPLATSTTSSVKPNLMFIIDNSGSMGWFHMPDIANNFNGDYGYATSQCNQVYYDPAITYDPPLDAAGNNYSNSSFTGAWDDGYNTGDGTTNLNTSFRPSSSYTSQSAFYYAYSGAQTTDVLKNYADSSNTFYRECNSNLGSSPGNGVFSKRRLATTMTTTIAVSGTNSTSVSSITVNGVQLMSATSTASTSSSTVATNIAARITLNGFSATASGSTVTITGPASATDYTPVITQSGSMTLTPDVFPDTSAAKLTNFANWYSYYRNRLLMMKTSAGRAFSSLNNTYRIGLMKISQTNPVVYQDTFETTHRSNWYTALYNITTSGSTPLRRSLADAGKYYAGKLSGTDPVQYSCQQNFTILSTDGYWNGDAGFKLDGSAVDNQDGTAARPMLDGAQAATTVTTTYLRYDYSETGSKISALGGQNCNKNYRRITSTPQTRSCSVTGGNTNCTSWVDGDTFYLDPYTSDKDTCVHKNSVSTPSPNPSTTVVVGTPVTTAGSSGGTSDTLADVAMYYYQTDLRTAALSNCTGALGVGEDVCQNNVFISSTDSNVQQHMTTFTLGLGASGKMIYSSSYQNDNAGDYVSVKLGSTANASPIGTISVNGAGSTSVSSITVNGVQLMSGTSTADASINTVASNIAARITQNGFSATATGNTVRITGPASANSHTPVITQSGTMSLTPSAMLPICSWQTAGTVCNWPTPGSDKVENIDDLWHAAVNGRGAYFSATNPTTLAAGLSSALSGINARKGSAAAAATSTLNPVAGNNYAYVASYTTVKWQGNLEARGINTDTGAINENATWCAENVVEGACTAPSSVLAEDTGDTTTYYCVTPDSVTCADGELVGTDCRVPMATACTGTMQATVADSSDTRTIKTANSTGTTLMDFTHANLTATQQTYFSAAWIGTLNQWSSLDAAQKTAAAGDNLVNYVRGQYGFEDRTANAVANRLYRQREAVLGDALESQPAFISKPVFSYPYPGYSTYVTAQADRAGVVYMGANDGMMHAFYAQDSAGAGSPCVIGAIAGEHCGGEEAWAYVPSMVIPNLWKLADTNYATQHRNFVNGSPTTSDIYCPGNCGGVVDATYGDSASWRTILVAGLNGGGRGYYALDITVPGTPTLLWEVTPTTGMGIVKDADMGYSFGQPIITRKADGTWVVLVTSGYNNTLPGNGKGYLYVLNASTGAIISKITTNMGDTTTPSGLARIAAWNDEPAGNQAGYVYGGDLLGNLWRFDINSAVAATVADGEIGTGDVMKFASLFSDGAGTLPQPITTTPVLGKIAGKRVIFIGTGKYLENGDLTTTQVQTQYAIKDDNATSTLVNPRNSLVNQTLSNNPDGTATRLTTGNAVNFYTGRGWYIDFPDSGERVNIDSKLVEGTLLVPTIVPSNTACSPGGYGWLNFLDYKTGGAINSATSIASLKYDSTIVGVNVLYIDGAPMVGVVTSTDPTPKINEDVGFAAVAAGFTGKRVIWRELIP